MDLSFEGGALDPSKCSKLTMDEKRELVYHLSEWSGASETLQSWSRQEILQILCAEMGKERKYTGLTKLKIIEHLLKIVSEKRSGDSEAATDHNKGSSPAPVQKASKRQRKADNPSRLPAPSNYHATNSSGGDLGNILYCKNSACRATLRQDDAFCKRCSCCICYQYDDNKDPSLWLTCSSEPPFQGVACGMSCHLDCALKHENSGIAKDGCLGRLDGSFRCVACEKVNDLLGCWRKQLVIAKNTRRVDVLCYRVSVIQKLLNGTVKYKQLHEIVDDVAKRLEAEVGPLTGLPVKMGRGIVNRLSSGPEVQKLCASAMESLDKMLSSSILLPLPNPKIKDLKLINPSTVRFEDVCANSLAVVLDSKDPSGDAIVGYKLWHRQATHMDYPSEPTCTLYVPNTKFIVTSLSPCARYYFRIVSFDDTRDFGTCEVQFPSSTQDEAPSCTLVERSQSPAMNCSNLSNPSSVEDETNHNTLCSDQIVNRADNYHSNCKGGDKIISAHISYSIINCTVNGDGRTPVDAAPLLDKDVCLASTKLNADVDNLDGKQSLQCQIAEVMSTDNGSDTPVQTGMENVPFVGNSDANLPITPCKLEIPNKVQGRNAKFKFSNKDLLNRTEKGEGPQDGSASKKRSGESQDEECTENGHSDRDFEYYVKVVRWLECEGYIEKNFRQKFLTWYSLRATPQEIRVVKAFVDTFIEDPASLAEQLVDTFSECISNRKLSVVPAGFCMKLCH
uniref:Fibronectin type-III domain-containing protein n=1 Tax=Rhizophora mucronata TaxID=61149 RepID=A0A2P2LEU0_RHIMU